MENDQLLGTLLDSRYEVTRRIGGGGMGSVYEAHHAGTGRRVAIKVISTGDITKDAQLVGRFQREAKAAGAIDTLHICQVLDTGTDPDSGLPFMVMEYMAGEDVQQLFQRVGVISPDLALRIVAQTCLGLQKAHESGVVHRDIKPANLFLAKKDGEEITVKLLDFGIAKVKMEHASSTADAGLTRTGTMLGSPLYMSPEQARGTKNIDHRADIWSLGIVLYQALTGRTPYHHIDALGELIIAICSEPPKPVQDFAPWVPKDVASIVHKALQLDPAQRYQSASEMLAAIKPFLPHGNVIQESMLVGINDAERANVATKLSIKPAPPVQLSVSSLPNLPSNFPPAMSTGGGAVTSATSAGTQDGIATERLSTQKPSNTKFIIAGAVIGIAAAAVVAIKFIGSRETQTASNPTATPTVTTTIAAAPTESMLAPASSSPIQVSDKDIKTLTLAFLPENASVLVNGVAPAPSDIRPGFLELKGEIGDTFRIELSVTTPKLTKAEEVVSFSNKGLTPPLIKLDVEAGKIIKVNTPPPGLSSGTSPTTPPTTGKKPPGFETKMDD
ncbi:MAG: serine/threonine-protein kinase [Polyangiaceae bacterium]